MREQKKTLQANKVRIAKLVLSTCAKVFIWLIIIFVYLISAMMEGLAMNSKSSSNTRGGRDGGDHDGGW